MTDVNGENGPGQPSIRPNRTPGNIIKSLFDRQLGLPSYSRSGESACSNFNEKRIGRQLIYKRTKSVEGHGLNSVKPAKVKFEQPVTREKTSQFKLTTDWIQLELSMPDRTKVGLVNGQLWKRYREGQAGQNAKFKEEFYFLDVFNFGLQRIGHSRSTGKLYGNCTVTPRALSTASSTYLLTCTGTSSMRAYDVMKRRVSNELKLNLNITVPPLKFYTVLDICPSTEKIFVNGVGVRRLVKVVVILDYPPNWNKVGVVYVDKLEFQLNVYDGMCFMCQDKSLHLTTWPFIMEKVEIIPPTGKSLEASLSVKYEGRLSKMPTLINTILCRTSDPRYIFMNTVIPQVLTDAKAGLKFFLPIHLDNLVPPPSVYEFHRMIVGEKVNATQFPDNSQRVLIYTEVKQYEVVTFKYELSGDSKVVKPCVSHPFNYWDELETNRNSTPTTSRSTRLKRSGVSKAKTPPKSSILHIAYCEVVDLLAVLMTDDEEECMVILYDPFDLSVFKAFPPVRIWPPKKNGEPNLRRWSIKNVQFGFMLDFIFIEFEYYDFTPPREVFCVRLLSESVN